MSTTMGMTVGALAIGALALGFYVHRPAEAEPAAEVRTEAVVRQGVREADGTAWRAHTTVLLGSGPVTVDEEVVLDEAGTLVRAFTRVTEKGEESRTWYDPRTAVVTTESSTVTHREHIPMDEAPWVYGPVRASHGELLGTPLAAWATYRASQHHEHVRRVEANGSALVPVDQLVVATDGEARTVLVGDDVVDVGASGPLAMHLRAPQTTLVLASATDAKLLRFRAEGEPLCMHDRSFMHGT